jgi:hypothetical protein
MTRSFQSQMRTLAFLLMAGVVAACGASSGTQAEAPGHSEEGDHGEHGEHGDEEAEPAKGPRGGRLLEDGKFALEVTIFETGVDPVQGLSDARRRAGRSVCGGPDGHTIPSWRETRHVPVCAGVGLPEGRRYCYRATLVRCRRQRFTCGKDPQLGIRVL